MEETRDSRIENKASRTKPDGLKRIGIIAAIVAAAFLLGLIPMWLSARSYASERDQARANLRLSQLQNRLATAAISARRGEYEQARQETSDFFTDLRSEVDTKNNAFNEQQRNQIQPILVQRDEIITLLARNDPASAEWLADSYLAFRQATNAAPQE